LLNLFFTILKIVYKPINDICIKCFSGHIAERMNLRYFLSGGMILVGIMTAAFGMGYFINIHNIYFFVIVQVSHILLPVVYM